MNRDKEAMFPIPYKAPLAEIPIGALQYAELARGLREAKKEFRKAKRLCKPDGILHSLLQKIALIERDMENHAKQTEV